MSRPIPSHLRRPVTAAAWLAVAIELAELARRLPRSVVLVIAVGVAFTGAMLVALVAAHWHALVIFLVAYLAIRYGTRAMRWHERRNVPPTRPMRPTARRKVS